jgi:hypothetical protein
MIVRAFLRCVGVQFSDDEIQVVFRLVQFQVMETLGGREARPRLDRPWRSDGLIAQTGTHEAVIVSEWALLYRPLEPIFEVPGNVTGVRSGECSGRTLWTKSLNEAWGCR